MEKKCTGCERVLPATTEYFHQKNGGYATRCKECIKSYYQRYYRENHEDVVERKRQQSYVYYHKHRVRIRQRKSGLYTSVISRRYYLKNRDKIMQQHNKYLKTEQGSAMRIASNQRRRDKYQSLPVNFSHDEWEACRVHFEHKCCYCGKEETLTRDHFIPLVKGGEYTINNIIPACKPCNSKKKQNDFFTWYPKKPFYSKQREQKILRYLNYNENKVQQLALL